MKTSKQSELTLRNQKVAIIHDWLYGGGAELVVEELHKLYPEAPIYTSYCSDEWRKRLDQKVVTGYLQNWPFAQLRKFLPLLRQRWFRNLDLSEYDLIISSSGNGEAKFALSGKKQKAKSKKFATSSESESSSNQIDTSYPIHVCYSHTPTHFYWRKYQEYLKNPGFRPKWLVRLGLTILVKPLRKRDYQAAQKVDYFIANSTHIQADIQKYYGRNSTVIWPPVDVAKFSKIKNQKSKIEKSGFIMWGRHVPYKKFDLAIQACNERGLPLIVVGNGPETENLKKIAGPTITFPGRIPDEELVHLAQTAEAFLFPGEEDFGIAPVEALAAGLPVIAYNSGGALDYVVPGKTGIFFNAQDTSSLIKVLEVFRSNKFDSAAIANYAEQFSQHNFQKNIQRYIEQLRR